MAEGGTFEHSMFLTFSMAYEVIASRTCKRFPKSSSKTALPDPWRLAIVLCVHMAHHLKIDLEA